MTGRVRLKLALQPGEHPRCRNPACACLLPKRPGSETYVQAKGYCKRCYARWMAAGSPRTGPPVPMTKAQCAAVTNMERREACEDRMREFAEWREVGRSVRRAALEVGVSEDTGYRYEASLRRQEQREEQVA